MSVVTCVGLAVQDLVFAMDEPVLLGEKNFASALVAYGGGPAANASVAIARLGGTSRLITALGTDVIGDEIVAELSASGVDCSVTRRVEAPSPLSAVVIDPDGDRTIFNRTDPALWNDAAPPTPDEIIGSSAVLVDVRWGAGALAAVHVADRLGIPSVVDCDLTEGGVSESLLRSAGHVVFSQPAFERIRGRATPTAVQSVSADFGGVIAVTKGSDGVIWSVDGAPPRQAEAFRIDAVDTLGAGDVFHGAYALGVAEGRSVDDIVRWASAVAAVKCSRVGGRAAFPTRDEVTRFLERSGT